MLLKPLNTQKFTFWYQ